MKQKNYYDILGVPEQATEEEIKKSYRSLAKQWHPDHNPGDAAAEARFKEISEAYEVLGDTAKRRKYDELRRWSSGAGGAGGGMSYEEFMRRFGGERWRHGAEPSDASPWGFGGSTLDDIFSMLFGGAQARQERPAGARGFAAHFGREGRPRGQGSGSRRGAGAAEPQPTSDPFFKRKGRDAYVDVRINVAQALLGSTLRVRTPSGKSVHLRIPAGTQPDTVLRVAGMGFAEAEGTGDLYVRTHLDLPASLTEEQKEAVRAMAAALRLRH